MAKCCKDTEQDTKQDNYFGSFISILSSHLFLFASLCYYYWGKKIESIVLFIIYLFSINYHMIPTQSNKAMDELLVKITMCISIIISLFYYNILPTIFSIALCCMYYLEAKYLKLTYNTNLSNAYHAIFIHFIGFLAIMSFSLN